TTACSTQHGSSCLEAPRALRSGRPKESPNLRAARVREPSHEPESSKQILEPRARISSLGSELGQDADILGPRHVISPRRQPTACAETARRGGPAESVRQVASTEPRKAPLVLSARGARPALNCAENKGLGVKKAIEAHFQGPVDDGRHLSPGGSRKAVSVGMEFYAVGKLLGKGAFGKVNVGVHKLTEELAALKLCERRRMAEVGAKKCLTQEVGIIKRLTGHPNIVQLFEVIESSMYVVLVMEFAASGDLLRYVRQRRRLAESCAQELFKQVIDGISHVHAMGVVHRDIKLENLLLDSFGCIKIADFGVAVVELLLALLVVLIIVVVFIIVVVEVVFVLLFFGILVLVFVFVLVLVDGVVVIVVIVVVVVVIVVVVVVVVVVVWELLLALSPDHGAELEPDPL
ncbi:unnamed protein product, partial [Polarella glacialis]